MLVKVSLTRRSRSEASGQSVRADGTVTDTAIFSRGHFHRLLSNPIYHLKILPEGITQATCSEPDPTLLKLLRRVHAWRQQLEMGPPDTI